MQNFVLTEKLQFVKKNIRFEGETLDWKNSVLTKIIGFLFNYTLFSICFGDHMKTETVQTEQAIHVVIKFANLKDTHNGRQNTEELKFRARHLFSVLKM